VSWTARIIIILFALFLSISSIVAGVSDALSWLDILYFCSYVKLTITLIKYMPQVSFSINLKCSVNYLIITFCLKAYMNFKRKSTVGWSIGNIFLDFTGGSLSMLQMFLNAHNYSKN